MMVPLPRSAFCMTGDKLSNKKSDLPQKVEIIEPVLRRSAFSTNEKSGVASQNSNQIVSLDSPSNTRSSSKTRRSVRRVLLPIFSEQILKPGKTITKKNGSRGSINRVTPVHNSIKQETDVTPNTNNTSSSSISNFEKEERLLGIIPDTSGHTGGNLIDSVEIIVDYHRNCKKIESKFIRDKVALNKEISLQISMLKKVRKQDQAKKSSNIDLFDVVDKLLDKQHRYDELVNRYIEDKNEIPDPIPQLFSHLKKCKSRTKTPSKSLSRTVCISNHLSSVKKQRNVGFIDEAFDESKHMYISIRKNATILRTPKATRADLHTTDSNHIDKLSIAVHKQLLSLTETT